MEGPGGTGAPRGGSGARGRECPSAAGREKGRKGPEAAGSGSGSERTGWRVPESSLGAWRGPRRTQPRVLRGFVGGACVGVSKSSRVPRDAHPRPDQVWLEGESSGLSVEDGASGGFGTRQGREQFGRNQA